MRRDPARLALATMLAFLACATWSAAQDGKWMPGKRVLQIDVRKADGSSSKVVAMLEPQETKNLLAPDGTKVEWFSVDNAVRIAKAFEKEGLLDDRALAETIVGMVGAENKVPGGKVPGKTDSGDFCLTLRMEDGGLVHIGSHEHGAEAAPAIPARSDEMGSRYLLHPADGGRIVHWSVDEAMRIRDGLLASGYSIEDVMAVWVGMRWSPPSHGVPDKGRPGSNPATEVDPIDGRPLDPPCGQCQNGIWNINIQACVQSGSSFNCTVCTACPG